MRAIDEKQKKKLHGLIVINIVIFYRTLHAVYITIDGCHYVWQKAQTAILLYTRARAD